MNYIYNIIKNKSLINSDLLKNPAVFVYLLAAVLITIPLEYAFGSMASLLFLVISFSSFHKFNRPFNKSLFLPILFFFLMVLSISWSQNIHLSTSGLQKELLFLFTPLAFLYIPKLNQENVFKAFRIYSFSMVFYAFFYIIKAIYRYILTGNIGVFFYHELVTLELNAIYVSVFSSFALFYFISLKNKSVIERSATVMLGVLVFLLSSKSIIFIDFLLLIYYYIYFSETRNSIKFITIATVSAFMIFSFVFVPNIKERFLIEYETAFVDNTINKNIGNEKELVYNVSLKQAWNNKEFQQNNFFPGTALRVFQARIFIEMLQEQPILFTGFGLDSTQEKIREKAKQYNLYYGYGDFNFHNQYVQIFAELGVFGFLILIAMLFVNIRKAIKNKNFLHIVFSVTMIILFLTESFFCRQRGVVFFITLYCMFNILEANKKEVEKI